MKTSTSHKLATAIVHLDPRVRGGLRFGTLGHQSAKRVREEGIVCIYISWSVIEVLIVDERTVFGEG